MSDAITHSAIVTVYRSDGMPLYKLSVELSVMDGQVVQSGASVLNSDEFATATPLPSRPGLALEIHGTAEEFRRLAASLSPVNE